MAIEKDIGYNMLMYRAKHNMTQAELAKLIGVSLQTINSIENGKQTPRKLTRIKIEMTIGEEDNELTGTEA